MALYQLNYTHWPAGMNKNQIIDHICISLETAPAGVECSFVNLHNGTGVKVYPWKNWRDEAYFNQMRSYEIGLAPQVFDEFDIDFQLTNDDLDTIISSNEYADWATCGEIDTLYCYITEYVKPCWQRGGITTGLAQWRQDTRSKRDRIINELYNSADFNMLDDHCYNWGMSKRLGGLIPLDFGNP